MNMRKASTFIGVTFLAFFGFLYAHMNVDLFWTNPIGYLRISSFGYNFMVSTDMGLLWLYIPILAFFLFYADTAKGGTGMKIVRGGIGFTVTYAFFVVLLALLSQPSETECSWQIVAMKYAYGSLAKNENMAFFALFCYVRLLLVFFLWQGIVVLLDALFADACSVFACLLVALYVWHAAAPKAWRYSFWQVPDVDNTLPMAVLFWHYGLVLCAVGLALFIVQRAKRRGKPRPVSSPSAAMRVQRNALQTVACLLVPAILRHTMGSSGIGGLVDGFTALFHGMPWGQPFLPEELGFERVLLLSVPAMLAGQALWAPGKNGREAPFRRKIGALALNIVWTMLLMTICLTLLSRREAYPGPNGFILGYSEGVRDVLLCGVMAFLQMMIACMAHFLVVEVTQSPEAGLLTWIVPYFLILLFSNEDRLYNKAVYVNWSMLLRSNLFSRSYVDEVLENGIVKRYALCTFSPYTAVLCQCILFAALCLLGYGVCRRKHREGSMAKHSG